MALSNKRTGMITSSEIVALTSNGRRDMTEEEQKAYKLENPKGTRKTIDGPGVPFYTYVEECIIERFYKHSLENDVEVKAMAWGKLCEPIVHNLLSNEYILHSEDTEIHPDYPEWRGTPDGTKLVTSIEINEDGTYKVICDTVTDIKCPLSRKGHYNLIRRLYDFVDGIMAIKKQNIDGNEIIQQIRKDSKEGEKYYWQLVSNACILGARFAELIVFMPYYEELEDIQLYNSQLAEPYWLVARAKDGELPYIDRETGIENVNIIRFEVPQCDKDYLESRVILAIEEINK
ncbi:MAG: hypothetical protein V4666_08445 [Bacteroidota bacterium]